LFITIGETIAEKLLSLEILLDIFECLLYEECWLALLPEFGVSKFFTLNCGFSGSEDL